MIHKRLPRPARAPVRHNGGVTRDIVLLGSTGSIGTQALDIIARNPDRFRVVALAAGGSDLKALAGQALETGAEVVGVADPDAAIALALTIDQEARHRGLRPGEFVIPQILAGPTVATEIAGMGCDVVLNGMTGSVGLKPTLAALDSGAILALANKESLVVGGKVVTSAAQPGQIVPVDSEHSALAQALRAGAEHEVARLVLTASGGPFRGWTSDQLAAVTPEQALAHPTWKMGPVVTINSATLVNKGLEVIEAHLLFGFDYSQISTVVHPQSIVHSLVEFTDGSTLAQASPPDMRMPISLGLGWPDRVPGAAPSCDWSEAATWEFFPLDEAAFPAVRIAREVGQLAGTAPAVFNAANEECVEAFLSGRLAFPGILSTVERVVAHHVDGTAAGEGSVFVSDAELTVDAVLAAEAWARPAARELIGG